MEVNCELYIPAALARERTPVPTEQEAGWAQEQAGRFEEDSISLTGFRTRTVHPVV